MEKIVKASQLSGNIVIPPSKSDSQRAILCAGLAAGQSILYNLGASKDELAMLQNIQRFGAKVTLINKEAHVDGSFDFPKEIEFNCGESGLGLRLMAAMCAVFEGNQVLNGEGSILNRSHAFLKDELPKMGVEVHSIEHKLPVTLSGQIQPGSYKVDGSQSSQYISGLLMAMPLLKENSELIVGNLKSKPYINMTLSTLRAFGVEVENNEEVFKIRGNQTYQPIQYTIEGDWSSASCWLAAAALGQSIEISGLSISSKQADVAMLDALQAANCVVEFLSGSIRVDGENRRAFNFDATHAPDLFPALVLLALGCSGKSTIKGVSRLKNKESDRGITLQQEFGKLGVKIELLEDEMHVHGGSLLKSAEVFAHNDHRIAMSLGIAGTLIKDGIILRGAEAVAKSYPSFWEDLENCN